MQSRSNSIWLAELDQHGGSGVAADELRGYLRRGLAKALRNRSVDDADLDDFAQDALVRIFEGLKTFRGDSQFTTWAMAVALRTAFSTLRRRRYDGPSLDEFESADFTETGSDPADAAARRDVLDALTRAIHGDLTPRQRSAVLAELAGMPTAEIADRLAIKPNALYKLHHDARKKLRRAMHGAGFTDADVREALATETNAP